MKKSRRKKNPESSNTQIIRAALGQQAKNKEAFDKSYFGSVYKNKTEC